MNANLHTSITTVLTDYLNRAPTEAEIINAQSDPRIMMWINQRGLPIA